MTWRRARVLLLVLLIAAPLSSGDKGLWLSLGGVPLQLHAAPVSRLPAEHTTLVPDAIARLSTSRHIERTDASRALCQTGSSRLARTAARWSSTASLPLPAPREALTARPSPRAPPV